MAAILHILPKKHLNLIMNEHGDIYEGTRHLGELNLYMGNNVLLIGPTGPTGPDIKGLKGYRGPIGDTGTIGKIGYSITGYTGPDGEDGEIGLLGPCGVKGRTGTFGPMGVTGDCGSIRYTEPRSFIHAKTDKNFIYNDDSKLHYNLIPWTHVINNGFVLKNMTLLFPVKWGTYKIEIGFQLTNFSDNVCKHVHKYDSILQVELYFNSYCKKYTTLVPYCKSEMFNLSPCESIHYIYTVNEVTEMTICINSNGKNIDIQNELFLNVVEII